MVSVTNANRPEEQDETGKKLPAESKPCSPWLAGLGSAASYPRWRVTADDRDRPLPISGLPSHTVMGPRLPGHLDNILMLDQMNGRIKRNLEKFFGFCGLPVRFRQSLWSSR